MQIGEREGEYEQPWDSEHWLRVHIVQIAARVLGPGWPRLSTCDELLESNAPIQHNMSEVQHNCTSHGPTILDDP